MEIPRNLRLYNELIQKSLNESKNILEDEIYSEIEIILNKIDKCNINELINCDNSEILPDEAEILIEIRLEYIRNNKARILNKDVLIISRWLKKAKMLANKSINNLVYLYPVALIFNYLQLNPEFLKLILNEKKVNRIISNISGLFNKISYSLNPNENAPYSEVEYLKNYKNGIKSGDIKKVYDFIGAYERGKGFKIGTFTSFLSRLLLLNPSKYFDYLNSIKEPVIAVHFLLIIKNKSNRQYISLLSKSSNKWLILEYIRQMVTEPTFKYHNNIDFIINLFQKIYYIDENFLVEGIIFLVSDPSLKVNEFFGKAFGIVLSNINNKHLAHKLIDSYGISKYDNYSNFWTHLSISLKAKNNNLHSYMTKIIFENWNNFLVEQYTSDEYPNKILITDYNEFIFHKYRELLENDEKKFMTFIGKYLDKIINYNSYWIKYASEKRFIPLTFLYIISFAWRSYSKEAIEDKNLNDKLIIVLDDKRLYLSLFHDIKIPTAILKIKENFHLD